MKNIHDTQKPEVPMIEKEKYLRLAADFENYRKNEGKRIADDRWAARRDSLLIMLDYIDGNEVGWKNSSPEIREKYSEWYRGMLQAHKQGIDELNKLGVTRIETIGKEFDPTTMEAAQMKPPDTPGQEGMVKGEVQAGYTLHGRVIRPARVIIYQ